MPRLIIGMVAVWTVLGCQQQPQFPSGVPYTHHIQNEGSKPQEGDVVTYHFVNSNAGGILYSTYQDGRPRKMRMPAVTQSNPASDMTEALLRMSEGDSLSFRVDKEHLPPQHRANVSGGGLVFGVRLLDIFTQAEERAEVERTQAKGQEVATAIQENIYATLMGRSSGFTDTIRSSAYRYIQHGQGAELAPGDRIRLHYQTYLMRDSQTPDKDTYAQAQPVNIQLGKGETIPAWEALLPQLRVGDELIMLIPPADGLGASQMDDWWVYLEVVSKED